jgi:hypothetical protein
MWVNRYGFCSQTELIHLSSRVELILELAYVQIEDVFPGAASRYESGFRGVDRAESKQRRQKIDQRGTHVVALHGEFLYLGC